MIGTKRMWGPVSDDKLELNAYLYAPKALLKVPKHFISTACSFVNSPPKLCRFDEHVA